MKRTRSRDGDKEKMEEIFRRQNEHNLVMSCILRVKQKERCMLSPCALVWMNGWCSYMLNTGGGVLQVTRFCVEY